MIPNIIITSDGTGLGTYVKDSDGKRIPGVSRIIWDIDNEHSKLTLEFVYPMQVTVNQKPELIRMGKWVWLWYPVYLTADVHPEHFGTFYAAGYRVRK